MRAEIAVTVDSVILCKSEGKFKLVLVKRKNEPFKDKWALPGGFVEQEEDLADAAKRELQEETGLVVDRNEQIGTFGKPGRDPRGRTISIVYLSLIDREEALKAADDAAEAAWFDIDNLPELAFDHSKIVEKSYQYL
ncbi:NUDIX domain-containing protein [Zunongwangia pacifica]|uniref:NUDIX hydrolase n=1 Tax=Zunongwangia pacifica TaxID=2911062 RepID=A0A9X1ZQR9_9FLAO|nr:NUDIX hydrolase [Zunongwangia pacifica]MCL6219267.1 NUDIX hydrolase [Zunongwangia pacifica]